MFIALKNKDTPAIAKVFAAITVAYALSPVDLVPDFIPVLGYLDDIIILPLLIWLTVSFIPDDVWKISLKASEDLWKDGKYEKWYFDLPIIICWIVAIYALIKVLVCILN